MFTEEMLIYTSTQATYVCPLCINYMNTDII